MPRSKSSGKKTSFTSEKIEVRDVEQSSKKVVKSLMKGRSDELFPNHVISCPSSLFVAFLICPTWKPSYFAHTIFLGTQIPKISEL